MIYSIDTLNDEFINKIYENYLHPTIVINLTITPEEIIYRMFDKVFSWTPPPPPPPPEESDEEPEEPLTAEELEEMKTNKISECKEEIRAKYESDQSSIEHIIENFKEHNLLILPAISALGPRERVYERVLNILSPYLKCKTPYERCVILTPDDADHYLASNYYSLSKFGTFCPVSILDSDRYIKNIYYPVLYRHNIYYMRDYDSMMKFIANPLLYTNQPPPLPNILPQISIIGPPLSGKTTLAKRLVHV